MKPLTKSEMKRIIQQWGRAASELERQRRKALGQWVYDWRMVDALLECGERWRQSRRTSGLVAMQQRLHKKVQS